MELLTVFLMSAVPIIEQRGAIPMGIFAYNMNPVLVLIVSLLGSLLPVPFILLLFNSIFKWMKRYRVFDSLNNIIENKIRKNSGKLEKYKEIGLIIFVGIPLPTTGLWTGSAVAAFMGLDFKKSLLCNVVGGLISSIVITALCIVFPVVIPH